ncbi:class I SAM-dependent methyltransferase [Albidovulum sp.]|uniref:class I SAM-dependent methyltransferase n=1 Tax=Albidovulum sp. TaxID=1872424 RepID=UPI003D7CEE82
MYELIGWLFRNDTDLVFMNYGYADPRPVSGCAVEGAERYSAQLYHAVASRIPLAGKRVLDVGSGRGGGAAHIHRHFGPRETVGCDVARQAVAFSKRVHGGVPGLSFVQADAGALPFGAAEFDAVTNVESAHCYRDRQAFFQQVHRVLRPGGTLLFADFTPPRRDPVEVRRELAMTLAQVGFGGVRIDDVTSQILSGLDADDARRRREIDARFPFGTRKLARLWAGTTESWIYRDFAEGRRAYFIVEAVAQPHRPLPAGLSPEGLTPLETPIAVMT